MLHFQLLLLSFGFSLNSLDILHPFCIWLGFSLSALPTLSYHTGLYCKATGIKVTLTQFWLEQKVIFNKGKWFAIVYNIAPLRHMSSWWESHDASQAYDALFGCSKPWQKDTPKPKVTSRRIGSIPSKLWPRPRRCFYFRHRHPQVDKCLTSDIDELQKYEDNDCTQAPKSFHEYLPQLDQKSFNINDLLVIKWFDRLSHLTVSGLENNSLLSSKPEKYRT